MKKYSFYRTLIVILLSVLFVFLAMQIAHIFIERKAANDSYEDLQSMVVIQETELYEDGDQESLPEQSESEPAISIDFETLQSKYSDAVGWIYCDGTPINYPVAQGRDNNQYLRHLLSGEYNTAGTIFADYRCGEIGEAKNYIVYGHNMKNGTMFSSITKYKEQVYYEEHPEMYFITPNRTYKIELLAGYVTSVNSDAYKLDYESEEQFEKYIDQATKKSTFKSNAEYTAGDRIITLSTCSYEFTNARYVVVGLIKEI